MKTGSPGPHGSSCPDLMTLGDQRGGLKITGIGAHRGASKWTVRKTAFSSFQRSGHSLGFTRLGTSLYRMIFVQIQL